MPTPVLIAFVGDTHGRVMQCLAAVLRLQEERRVRFDLVIQVGDFGFPEAERMDATSRHHLEADPSEGELMWIWAMEDADLEYDRFECVERRLAVPVLFVRGNHEDFYWLDRLQPDWETGTDVADPFGLFHWVPDGCVVERGGCRIAFLGGVEELAGEPGISARAYAELIELPPNSIDVLVTHEGPFGSSVGFQGDTHGSPMISRLVDRVQPRFHVFGHAHQCVGPINSGRTTYLGLDGLRASRVWHPAARGLKPGCLGVLDTSNGTLDAVHDAWLAQFPTPFDAESWRASLVEQDDPAVS
jgi:Icc-related predicted phosphoesterase